MSTPLTATGARKQWAYHSMILEAAHLSAQCTKTRGSLAIALEQEARRAEELAHWAREYARLMTEGRELFPTAVDAVSRKIPAPYGAHDGYRYSPLPREV